MALDVTMRGRPRPSFRAPVRLLLLALAGGLSCSAPPPFPGYHLVLVNIETLRADFAGFLGSPLSATPELDSLAARGIVVERAYTAAPWTRPSVASLWTGLYPGRHGADRQDLDARLSGEVRTIAMAFREGGYRTFGFVTNSNLSPVLGFGRGFDEYRYLVGAPGGDLREAATAWVDSIFASVDSAEDGPPLFIALHYDEPHGAFFRTTFRDRVDGMSRGEMIRVAEGLSPGDRMAAIEGYRDLVRAVDREVGALVRDLEDRLGPRMIVVVTADHGEEWFDHGGLFHGFTLHEELLRVPFLLYSPSLTPGRRTGPIRSVDVLPTLARWTGLPAPSDGDGRAVGDALLGWGTFHRDVFAETTYEKRLEAFVRGDVKLIRDRTSGEETWYALAGDPGEARALEREPKGSASIRRELDRLRRRMDEGAAGREKTAPIVDESLREELEAIGYVAGLEVERGPWPAGRAISWRELRERYRYVSVDDPLFTLLPGSWRMIDLPPRWIGGPEGGAEAAVRVPFRRAWLVFGSHAWSGVAEISADGEPPSEIDLYSSREGDRQLLVPIEYSDLRIREVRVGVTGKKNPGSFSSEVLLDGIVVDLPPVEAVDLSGTL